MIRQINRCNIIRKNLSDQLSQYHNQYDELKEKVRESEEKIAAMTVESTSLEKTMKEMEEERQVLLREITTSELDLNEMKRSVEKQEEVSTRNQQKKQALLSELQDKQQQLQQTIVPRLEV